MPTDPIREHNVSWLPLSPFAHLGLECAYRWWSDHVKLRSAARCR